MRAVKYRSGEHRSLCSSVEMPLLLKVKGHGHVQTVLRYYKQFFFFLNALGMFLLLCRITLQDKPIQCRGQRSLAAACSPGTTRLPKLQKQYHHILYSITLPHRRRNEEPTVDRCLGIHVRLSSEQSTLHKFFYGPSISRSARHRYFLFIRNCRNKV